MTGRKSIKRKYIKRQSIKRKSIKSKSIKRQSIKRKYSKKNKIKLSGGTHGTLDRMHNPEVPDGMNLFTSLSNLSIAKLNFLTDPVLKSCMTSSTISGTLGTTAFAADSIEIFALLKTSVAISDMISCI